MGRITDIGLYSFSALIQADAAIIGLLAILLIYLLQQLENEYQDAIKLLKAQTNDGLVRQVNRMMVAVNCSEVYGMLDRYAHLREYIECLAFTNSWKKRLVKKLAGIFLFLLFHIIISCTGLYLADSIESFINMDQNARILSAMISFPVLVLTCGILFYRAIYQGVDKSIPPMPTIAIAKISHSNISSYFPRSTDSHFLYRVLGTTSIIFDFSARGGDIYQVMVRKEQNDGSRLTIKTLMVNSKDQVHPFLEYITSPEFKISCTLN